MTDAQLAHPDSRADQSTQDGTQSARRHRSFLEATYRISTEISPPRSAAAVHDENRHELSVVSGRHNLIYRGRVSDLTLEAALHLCKRDCMMYTNSDENLSWQHLLDALLITWSPHRSRSGSRRGKFFFCKALRVSQPTLPQLTAFHEHLRSVMQDRISDPTNDNQFARFRDDGESPMLSLKDIFVVIDQPNWLHEGVILACRKTNSADVLKFVQSTEHAEHDHSADFDREDCYCVLRLPLHLAMMAVMFRDPRRMQVQRLDSSRFLELCSWYETRYGLEDPCGPLQVYGNSPTSSWPAHPRALPRAGPQALKLMCKDEEGAPHLPEFSAKRRGSALPDLPDKKPKQDQSYADESTDHPAVNREKRIHHHRIVQFEFFLSGLDL